MSYRSLIHVSLVAMLLASVVTSVVVGQQPQPDGRRPMGGRGAIGPAVSLTDVDVHRDLEYARVDDQPLLLDLYVPKTGAKPFLLVIWIHGGGWKNGSKEGWRPAQPLLAKGYAVASINYRLSGQAAFPAQIHDCKAAVRWLRAHAKEYDLDAQRFAAVGGSAGGHLVALLGTSGDVKELEGTVGEHLDVSSRVQAVCDFYGPTDLAQMPAQHSANPSSPGSQFLGGPAAERKEQVTAANPITHITADDPPYLILHGDEDPVVPLEQSELLNDALHKAGLASELIVIEGAGHGGPSFVSDEVVAKVAAFLDKALPAGGK